MQIEAMMASATASASRSLVLAALLGASACARPATPDVAPPSSAAAGPDGGAPAHAPDAPAATVEGGAADGAAIDAAPAAFADDAVPEEDAGAALDFIDDARVVFAVGACGAAAGVPSRFDANVVAKHCADLGRAYDEYKKSWIDVAKPFIAALRPKDLPNKVVYPFGGGDLVTVLSTFPDATEITTISLEPAGDVRPVETLAPERLGQELAAHRSHLERLLEKAHSRTDNLEKESKTDMPGEILFDLAALVLHGDVPVSLRYFHIGSEGAIHYVTQADVDAQAHHPKAQRALFDDVELRFRSADGSGPVRILRHIAFNLDDEHLKADPSLLAYLNRRGKVAAMTKAASHLLWNDHFATIRGWLIDHTDWMISDSTGIPPRFAEPAGFSQETYGTFDGPAPFGLYDAKDAKDFKSLFAQEPARELAFRYGYPDKDGHAHLIVTKREKADGAP